MASFSLPSLQFLFENAIKAFKRFPWSITASLLATLIGIYLIEEHYEWDAAIEWINRMLCLALGIPLYFCIGILSDRFSFSKKIYFLSILGVTILLVALYFTFPTIGDTRNNNQPYFRYIIYNIIAHLLVSFLPFARKGYLNGFWNYNKTLFIRVLTSALYSGVLYLGLVLALVALKLLFEVKIPEELYPELAIIIFWFFNTWFFMAGIPSDFHELNENTVYPQPLKIFSQYILLPLLVLYLFILYGYGVKIVASWDWPKGIVSYLILCVSGLGIFTLLLLFPYGNLTAGGWIKKVSRGFYILLLPLLALLFIALAFRLEDYGITINRYLILFLGVWLVIVCLYFVIGKNNIRVIPISLAIMLLFITFGPWGMFSISEKSQVARLESILTNAKILVNGKMTKNTSWTFDKTSKVYKIPFVNEPLLSDSLHNEVYSIFNYLNDYHGFSAIRHWYSYDVDSIFTSMEKKQKWGRGSEASVYMESLGLEHTYRYKDGNEYYSFHGDFNQALEVTGYDYFMNISIDKSNNQQLNVPNRKAYLTYYFYAKPKLQISVDGVKNQFPLDSMLQELKKVYKRGYTENIPDSALVIESDSPKWKAKIAFENISYYSDSISPSSLNCKLLLKFK